uniref:Putative ribonuclease H-like protein n=1 Tax=Moniliophthora roreri TaxID=221103 RepID=A0A0W0EUB8_MONRR
MSSKHILKIMEFKCETQLHIYINSKEESNVQFVLLRKKQKNSAIMPPYHSLDWKTPTKIYSKKVPDVSYFRTPGCSVYVFIHKEQRKNKLSKKMEHMTFLDYAPNTKGYRFMRQDKTIFTASQADFDEEDFLYSSNSVD